jgi:hypothetical protein
MVVRARDRGLAACWGCCDAAGGAIMVIMAPRHLQKRMVDCDVTETYLYLIEGYLM